MRTRCTRWLCWHGKCSVGNFRDPFACVQHASISDCGALKLYTHTYISLKLYEYICIHGSMCMRAHPFTLPVIFFAQLLSCLLKAHAIIYHSAASSIPISAHAVVSDECHAQMVCIFIHVQLCFCLEHVHTHTHTLVPSLLHALQMGSIYSHTTMHAHFLLQVTLLLARSHFH
jgi:hypothetical protein